MSRKDYTEDVAVKQSAIEIFEKMFKGYNFSYLDVENEVFKTEHTEGTLGRETKAEVVLINRLSEAIKNLNEVTEQEIKLAIQEIINDRSRLSKINANKEVYNLIKNGVKIKTKKDGKYVYKKIKVIDFNEPKNNEYFLASEYWVSGEYGKKRADLVMFINGIPLITMEFKRPRIPVRDAFDNNISDYLDTIPQLFWYNVFILISNGKDTKIGSITSQYEEYFHWKKVKSENDKGDTIIDTALHGTCHPKRILDLIENFILYETKRKLVAKYHQFIGVNNLINAFHNKKKLKGKLGVFWHTQRAGKTNSMVFFTQKVLRKQPGNYTFLLVTDRQSLDSQIYQDFALVDAVTEEETQAKDGNHLKRLLKEDHRLIFTIINKFGTRKGEKYPVLSEREDIIVITDEAHRTQYDIFAMNMRTALPNASFVGFTGTPLMAKGNEKTKGVFGDYVSVYNFKDAVDDEVTVPLFYENRSDPLKLHNPKINEEMYEIIDEAELTPEQEKKLSSEFSKEYHLLTREDRIEEVAKDIVSHHVSKGYGGKSMIISVDRYTTVKMYDKVQKYWREHIKSLKSQLKTAKYGEHERIKEEISEMEKTDMAVIISKSQNEIQQFKKVGLDIKPHRKRLEGPEDLERKFKDTDDNLKIVFVCHMWLTGFNVRSLSTLYIDKPMKNQTLMQAISRPATAIPGKKRAFLVSYLDIFRPLKNALSLYAAPRTTSEGIFSLQEKSVLLKELEKKIKEMNKYLQTISIDYDKIISAKGAEKLRLLSQLEEMGISPILKNDETKNQFIKNSNYLIKLFNDCKPDKKLSEFVGYVALYEEILHTIKSLDPKVDISSVVEDLKNVLDKSIKVKEPEVTYGKSNLIDLSKINFDTIKQTFKKKNSNVDVERLKNVISFKLADMIKLNNTRTNYLEKFQSLIDDYNLGSLDQEFFFDELVKLSKDLSEEELRHKKEGLTEEELALFDKLKKPSLTKSDKDAVKKCAKDLLYKLKHDGLSAVDWRKKPQTKAKVRIEIEMELETGLPKTYTDQEYEQKCDVAFQHFFDNYFGEGQSMFALS
ncbi:MAG: type I restriction endonuclease subunit R [Nanoarchaeota archaeon]|nr:type I restriction endonuclease subunit R [Nanoarchaeota archaeon]MBU1977190.1 type I restriction endonuclease subunit R [Nanoarchaeota archaeon]